MHCRAHALIRARFWGFSDATLWGACVALTKHLLCFTWHCM